MSRHADGDRLFGCVDTPKRVAVTTPEDLSSGTLKALIIEVAKIP